MKIVRLTSKFMEEKLKIGWTEEDFASHFQISTESFSESVRNKFSQRISIYTFLYNYLCSVYVKN